MVKMWSIEYQMKLWHKNYPTTMIIQSVWDHYVDTIDMSMGGSQKLVMPKCVEMLKSSWMFNDDLCNVHIIMYDFIFIHKSKIKAIISYWPSCFLTKQCGYN